MNFLDKKILLFLNGFVGRWPYLDSFLAQFQHNNLLKGAVFLTAIWYLWFRPVATEQDALDVRKKLFATICAVIVGIIVARLFAHLLPFRVRPAYNAELHLSMPADARASVPISWSSFPSDHAIVWFTLAFGVIQLHRVLGALACIYACFLSVGRMYAAFHYPTDIIGAAVISAGLLWLFHSEPIRTALYAPAVRLERWHPGLYYAGAFLATYEIANLFDEVRVLREMTWRMVRQVI
jgi:membrane-associated phospholipid phosphatase